MEVDRILYIFGSFTRKKDKRKSVVEQSSISAGNSPIRIPRSSRPLSQALSSQNIDIAPRTSAYDDGSKVLKDWECGLCKKELVEPRLLACLHSFCTRCLQGLHHEGEAEVWSEVDGGSIQLDPGEAGSGSADGSAGSGYESDLRHSGSDTSWQHQHKCGIYTRKISGKAVQFLLCPTCGCETPLPLGGVSALPLNYVLLRKMVAAQQEERANVLCDLCNCDNRAESHCNQCLVSVCNSCGEAHGRQKATARHSLKPLHLVPVKFCTQHPKAELSVYCATCQQVVCRDCCLISHSGHALASASRAAAERARLLRDACERAKHVPDTVTRVARTLGVRAQEVDAQASRVESEIQTWAEQYRRAVEAHGRALMTAAARARGNHRLQAEHQRQLLDLRARHARDAVRFAEEAQASRVESEIQTWAEQYRRAVEAHGRALMTAAARARGNHRLQADEHQRQLLDLRARHARDAVKFAEELLAEAKEDELLSLSGAVLRRLERLTELQSLSEPPKCEMRFAPTAPVGGDSTLFGRLLTRAPDSDRCVLNVEGLQDLIVDCPHEAIFELRDNNGERIWCGGEQVCGYFRRRDSSARPALCGVADRGDGSYRLALTARSPGAYLLAVTLNNKPIKGSPFPCAARVAKAHSGQFHCCAFCSSGGRRDATCGCGSSMGGGYKGCGHGHAGWPGARHWSCCGRTQRAAPCTRATNTRDQLYQFSL